MFGFLKKKLKDAVEKISGVAKAGEAEEVQAGQIEEAERVVEEKTEIREIVKENEKNIAESGYEMTPEIREIVERPAERILSGQEPERTSEEIIGENEAEDVSKETEKVSEEAEKYPEKAEVIEEEKETFQERDDNAEAEKTYNEKPEEQSEDYPVKKEDAEYGIAETKAEEIIKQKTEAESNPEEVTIEIQKSAAEEVALPEFRREEWAAEKEPEGVTVEEIKQEAAVDEIKPEEVPQKKKSLFEKLGMRKPKKEKEEIAKPEPEPTKPEAVLPRGFESAGEAEKKDEKEKATFFKKIRKAISEKTIEEADIKDILWDLQIGLIENDVAAGAAEKIASDLKGALVGKSLPKKGIEEAVKDSMKKSVKEILDAGEFNLDEKIKSKKPFLAVFLGFNGVGKTTTIARVGHLLKQKGFSCIFAAADTWRAGAIQQIEEHGSRLGIKVIRQEYGSDPAAVIFDAKKYAESHGVDVILADTAGRSHTNLNLVDELKKIVRVNKPDLKVLVIDALTGNDVVEQAKYFNDAVGADAMIITKADVYEKGGSILSAVHTIRKPILYLGIGQGYGDLEEFDVEKVVNSLVE
ncbi:MAG: signal recognition particle-docking protein FtsY [Candidatus Aenigmatarchaeota archaeon]